LLLKLEELCDVMLGDWKLLHVSFKLKESVKPYHGRPYPIPKINKATLMKEINCLLSTGGIEEATITAMGLTFIHNIK
jgi:hypothetical protein